jgi:transposase-like protein
MPRHRSHSIEFKRQVAQEFVAGETLLGLAKRHDISRNLIRVWVAKFASATVQPSSVTRRTSKDRPCGVNRAFL